MKVDHNETTNSNWDAAWDSWIRGRVKEYAMQVGISTELALQRLIKRLKKLRMK